MTDLVARGPAASADESDGRRRRRPRQREIYLLRLVPVDSPVRRLWAGTKLLALIGLGVSAGFNTSWPAVGLLGAFVVGAVVLARIPLTVLPRPPGWLLGLLGLGALLALEAGGGPHLRIDGIEVGLGSLDVWTRLSVFGTMLLLASALIGWTTPLAEVAPAVARLTGPLRRLRLPVDEVAIVIGLAVRSLSLLLDDLRALLAARRLRPRRARSGGQLAEDVVDVMVTLLVVATRRARDVGDAISARGGVARPVPRGRAPGRADLVALLVVAAVCIGVATGLG